MRQQDASKVLLTSFGGLPLVMETFRALRLPESIQKHLPLLQRQCKYQEADYVESFISVFAGGGDGVGDFEMNMTIHQSSSQDSGPCFINQWADP
jgi:hypothetical protein